MAFSASSSFLHSIHKTHFNTERQSNLSQQDIESGALYPRRTKRVVVWDSLEELHRTPDPWSLESHLFPASPMMIEKTEGKVPAQDSQRQSWNQTPGPRLPVKHFDSDTFSQIIPGFLHPIIESLLPSRCCGGRSVEGREDMKTTQSWPSRSFFP